MYKALNTTDPRLLNTCTVYGKKTPFFSSTYDSWSYLFIKIISFHNIIKIINYNYITISRENSWVFDKVLKLFGYEKQYAYLKDIKKGDQRILHPFYQ